MLRDKLTLTFTKPDPGTNALAASSASPSLAIPALGSRWRGASASLLLVFLGALAAPLPARLVAPMRADTSAPPSYVPALEATHERQVPFDKDVITDLRALVPTWVFIGDSMLGTRVDHEHMSRKLNQQTIAMLTHAGTGSAFWYLAFKNWVVASGIKPRYVFFFFRDENMTDPLFRATGTYRWSLDRVALDAEPELNDVFAAQSSGPWFRVHRALDRAFGLEARAAAANQRLRDWPASWFAPTPAARQAFDERLNALFDLDHLRPISEADMQKADDARLDFGREVKRSVLPDMLRLANQHGLKLVFVRVQRRPTPTGPPPQSAAMVKYVGDLRAWLEARGAIFQDDTGDRDLPLAIYEDGDHIDRAYREYYTDWFLKKQAALFE